MKKTRQQSALSVRMAAAELANSRPHPRHVANGDEQKFRDKDDNTPTYLASFTKGMPHDYDTGLLESPEDFQQFVKAIDSGDPRDFIDTPLGPDGDAENPQWKSDKARGVDGDSEANVDVRAWESQSAGNTFDLQGPDSYSVTMPPAPALGSDELTAEMAEVYVQALLRDVPFDQLVSGEGTIKLCKEVKNEKGKTVTETKKVSVQELLDHINCLPWFADKDCCSLTDAEQGRKRAPLSLQTAFRGTTPGDNIGPYLSQFLIAGNKGIDGSSDVYDGYINYGSIRIDQRIRFAVPNLDQMKTWDEWFDVQNGADLRGHEIYQFKKGKDGEEKPEYRFITTPRDLATYVHYDALYEAYLNACLMMMGQGIPFDPGIPFQRDDYKDHQQGFAHFGGPHILSLVTEVATRALKAVRVQKFNIHRRFRPEALAARLGKCKQLDQPELSKMVCDLQHILELIDLSNPDDASLPNGNYLLPMAFCEGSPMHPSYGAGHATVAGACVTILKAFFDHKHPLVMIDGEPKKAFVAKYDAKTCTSSLDEVDVVDENGKSATLTVEGELNKLASNISIGRDWAGVHYFSDYIESLRMGEQIAIGILEEQKLTYGENFSMTVPLFDGGLVRI